MTKKKLILIGKKLGHSFSKQYFTDLFLNQDLPDWSYHNYEMYTLGEFDSIKKITGLKGCNVTIPYKESIMPLLDQIDERAQNIGAVNTIVVKEGNFIGYNTDQPAFKETLIPYLENIKGGLILGTGGASKAIVSALKELDIPTLQIGRSSTSNYSNFKDSWIKEYNLIVNCTPLGMSPNQNSKPLIPYDKITKDNLLYDLVYNPLETLFLKEGNKRGAKCFNGIAMLELQADLAFKLWKNE